VWVSNHGNGYANDGLAEVRADSVTPTNSISTGGKNGRWTSLTVGGIGQLITEQARRDIRGQGGRGCGAI